MSWEHIIAEPKQEAGHRLRPGPTQQHTRAEGKMAEGMLSNEDVISAWPTILGLWLEDTCLLLSFRLALAKPVTHSDCGIETPES